MRVPRMIISLTVAATCIAFVFAAQSLAVPLEGTVDQKEQENQGDQKVYRQTETTANLQSSLAHPDRLATVMSQFKLGAGFTEADRTKFLCRAQWFRLPDWLAGRWHCEEQKDEIKTEDFEKKNVRVELAARREDERTLLMGHQRDLNRQIWHFICVPFTALSIYTGNDRVVLVPIEVSIQQFPNSSPWRTVLNERFIQLELKNRTPVTMRETTDDAGNTMMSIAEYQIANVTQHDVVIVYSYAGKVAIDSDVSEEIYDEKGMPLSSKSTKHHYKKEGDFEALNRLDRVDLLKSITQFLQGNGMADRVPVNTKP